MLANQMFIYVLNLTLLAFLYGFIKINNESPSLPSKIYLHAIQMVFLLQFLEGLPWIINENPAQYSPAFHTFLVSGAYAMVMAPVLYFFQYLDARIIDDEKKLKNRKKIYILIWLFYVVLILLNIKGHFLFEINADNSYVRMNGMVFLSAISIGIHLFYILNIFKALKTSEGRIVSIVLLFTVLPILGIVIQIMFYGVPSLWALFTQLLLFTYFVIEREDLLKDALTGLASRRTLSKRLKQKLRGRKAFTLLMIDLNQFKSINDCYGHVEGDEALKIISRILQREVKQKDLICRYGGDEFVILVESVYETAGLLIENRILQAIKTYNEKKLKPYNLELSIGSLFIEDPKAYTEKKLLASVDMRMYLKK